MHVRHREQCGPVHCSKQSKLPTQMGDILRVLFTRPCCSVLILSCLSQYLDRAFQVCVGKKKQFYFLLFGSCLPCRNIAALFFLSSSSPFVLQDHMSAAFTFAFSLLARRVLKALLANGHGWTTSEEIINVTSQMPRL